MTNKEKEYVESVYEGAKVMDEYYKKFMEVTPKGKILDLGCGIGPVSNYLSEYGYDCVGYDIDEYHINMQRKYKPELNLFIGDMKNIPIQDEKANGAVYAYCLQNLSDEEISESLNSCYQNLTNDGKILIYVVSKLHIIPSFYVNVIDEIKMKDLLNLAGFKILSLDYDEDILIVIASK